LGLMPSEVDTTTLISLKFLLIDHGIYLRFQVKLLRGGVGFACISKQQAAPLIVVSKVGKLRRRHEREPFSPVGGAPGVFAWGSSRHAGVSCGSERLVAVAVAGEAKPGLGKVAVNPPVASLVGVGEGEAPRASRRSR
jgi:hypothetical protein